MPSQAEIIKFAGGLAPIVPFADYKRKFTTRKWILASRTVDCELKTWKREDQLDISQPVLPLETPVITYTTEEYDKHLAHQFWTREETDELMQLASRLNLRFIIIHDQFSGNKTLEDLKLRYHQVNRILLGKRKEAVSEFNFDIVREQSRKQQLLKLLGRTEKQLKEEQMLFLELKDFERRRDAWNEKREHLYKIISHNAEATKSISDKSNSLKKKKFKRKEDMGGIYLSSSRLSFIRPSLQQKVSQCLEEFGLGDPNLILPTTTVMDAMEQLYSSITSLVDVRKSLEKLNLDIAIAKQNKESGPTGQQFKPPSLKRIGSDSFTTPRDSKRTKSTE